MADADVFPIFGVISAVAASGSKKWADVRLARHSKWVPFGSGPAVAGTYLVVSPSMDDGVFGVACPVASIAVQGEDLVVRVTCLGEFEEWRWFPAPPEDQHVVAGMVDTQNVAEYVVDVFKAGACARIMGMCADASEGGVDPCEYTALQLLDFLGNLEEIWLGTRQEEEEEGQEDGARDGDALVVVGPQKGKQHSMVDLAYMVLSLGSNTAIGPTSQPLDVDNALRGTLALMTHLEARARSLGVLGDDSEAALQRGTMFKRCLGMITQAWMVARSLHGLWLVCAPDSDITAPLFGNFVVSFEQKPGTTFNAAVLLQHIFDETCAQQLRHKGKLVLRQHYISRKDLLVHNPVPCRIEGCSFSRPDPNVLYGTPEDGRPCLCFEHAMQGIATGVQVFNFVFQTPWRGMVKPGQNDAVVANDGAAQVRKHHGYHLSGEIASGQKPVFCVPVHHPASNLATRTWVPDTIIKGDDDEPCTVMDLVTFILDRRKSHEHLWTAFVNSHTTIMKGLGSYLENCRDPAFPRQTVCHRRLSFMNGMYDLPTNTFSPYNTLPREWAVEGAGNFIQEWFDPLLTVVPMEAIKAPGYTTIVDSQQYQPATKAFLEALLGRTFYYIGDHDNFQVLPVLEGVGACGKSSLLKALLTAMGKQNVAILNNEVEEKYALAGMPGKWAWMCMEARDTFRLPNTDLLSMVAGEPIPIKAKNMQPVTITWRMNGLVVCNILPNLWREDAGNSMGRRIMNFIMDRVPSSQDWNVQANLMRNLAPFIVLCNRRYWELANKVKGAKVQDLDQFIPAEVLGFKQRFKNATSVSAAYLAHVSQTYKIGCMGDDADPNGAAGAMDAGGPPAPHKDVMLLNIFRVMVAETLPSGAPRYPNLRSELPNACQDAIRELPPIQLDQERALRARVDGIRTKFTELEKHFGEWYRAFAPGGVTGAKGKAQGAPSITTKFKEVLRDLGMPVTTDAGSGNRADRWVLGLHIRDIDDGMGGGAGGAGAGGYGMMGFDM